MATKVKMIRTVSGEYFIGDYTVIEGIPSTGDITLNNARVITMQMTQRGPALGFTPVVPFAIKSPETITIPRSVILAEVDQENINDQIVKGYNSEVTGIDIATPPPIITPAH